MSEQTDNLILLLKPFGLTNEESKIYLNLLEENTLSALSISRNLHISRTKVYRLLDKLIKKQLVLQQCDKSGFKFKASHPSQLDFILSKKESELSALRKSLPETLDILKKHISIDNKGSQILYYRGLKGLSQVNWNLLNAKNEFLSYEISNANAYIPFKEAEKLRQELINKKIKIRTLANESKIKPFTQIKEINKQIQTRYISSKILTIKSDIFIYNNTFTICHYLQNKDIFCLEIKNDYLVTMQKQMFENLWNQSKAISQPPLIKKFW